MLLLYNPVCVTVNLRVLSRKYDSGGVCVLYSAGIKKKFVFGGVYAGLGVLGQCRGYIRDCSRRDLLVIQ